MQPTNWVIKGGHLDPPWLAAKFQILPLCHKMQNVSEKKLMFDARAYILMLIEGISFLINRTTCIVPRMYLSLLSNFERVGTYNWRQIVLHGCIDNYVNMS